MGSFFSYDPAEANISPDDIVANTSGVRFQTWMSKEPQLFLLLTDPTVQENHEKGHWVKAEVVSAGDGYNGTTDRPPRGCNTVPVAPPKMVQQTNGKWHRERVDDPLLGMVRGNEWNSSSGHVRSKAAWYTEFIDAEGNLRILELNNTLYQQLLAKVEELHGMAEEDEKTFDITERPFIMSKSADGRVLSARLARRNEYSKIDPADWPEPSDLNEHLEAIRDTVEEFLVERGLAHYGKREVNGQMVKTIIAGPKGEEVPDDPMEEPSDEPVVSAAAEIAGAGTALLKTALGKAGIEVPKGARRPELIALAMEDPDKVAEHLS
jgi:hypothetical protein